MTDSSNPCGIGLVQEVLVGREFPVTSATLDRSSVLHVPGASGLAGMYESGEAILGLFRRMMDLTDGTLRFTPTQVVSGEGGVVVVIGHTTGENHGRHLDTDSFHIFSTHAGAIRAIWMFHTRQDHVDRFWAA